MRVIQPLALELHCNSFNTNFFLNYSACTEYYLEDVIQMLNFVPPLPEKKKKREDVDDDEEVRITSWKLSVSIIISLSCRCLTGQYLMFSSFARHFILTALLSIHVHAVHVYRYWQSVQEICHTVYAGGNQQWTGIPPWRVTIPLVASFYRNRS